MKSRFSWDWIAPLAAAVALLALTGVFALEVRGFRASVIEWASRDLAARTALAAGRLLEPLATSDFRVLHAFGDACAAEGLRLTVLSPNGGVYFDSLRPGAEEPEALYAARRCGPYTVRLGLSLESVLHPVHRAYAGLALAGCLGGLAVLVVFWFAYRERVRLRELAKVERFRRDFVSDVSHELKTPLTGLLGAADLLAEEDARLTREGGGSPLVARLAGLVKTESARLNALAQSILDLARVERTDAPLDRRPTDLSALVSDVLASCESAAEAKGMRLTSDLPKEPLVASVDAALVAQAVSNLVLNAVRHSGSPDVRVALSVQGKRATLVVEDHGRGIPSDARERVFERFYRVDPSRAAESGGAGLGLAIARGVARRHGGDIVLGAAEPSGCRFVLTLPLG